MAGELVWVVRNAITGAIERVGYDAYEVVPDLFDGLMAGADRRAWHALHDWIDSRSGVEAEYHSVRFTMRREPLLPLDPNALDAAGVEAVAISLYHALERGGEPVEDSWADLDAGTQSMYLDDARAALAAYARHVGGGDV